MGERLEGYMQRASPTCREERGAERAASPHRPTLHPHFYFLKLHLYISTSPRIWKPPSGAWG